jgi:hypothetical protein
MNPREPGLGDADTPHHAVGEAYDRLLTLAPGALSHTRHQSRQNHPSVVVMMTLVMTLVMMMMTQNTRQPGLGDAHTPHHPIREAYDRLREAHARTGSAESPTIRTRHQPRQPRIASIRTPIPPSMPSVTAETTLKNSRNYAENPQTLRTCPAAPSERRTRSRRLGSECPSHRRAGRPPH